jgi:predicted HTH transcriptional regulator
MCSFLNAEGGTLFIGIKKTEDKRKVVEGAYYCESSKEELLINFRRLAQDIEPDIITDKRYVVDFVPIKEKRTNCFKHGFYVVKVAVKYGVRD